MSARFIFSTCLPLKSWLTGRPCPAKLPPKPLHGTLGGQGLCPKIRPCPKSSQTLPKYLAERASRPRMPRLYAFLKFRRTLSCSSLHICPSHVLLPPFKKGEKHTDAPWRPSRAVERALDFDVGRLSGGGRVKNRETWEGRIGRRRGDGEIRVSANAIREGRRGPGRDDGVCLSAS